MATVKAIYNAIDRISPFRLQMDFDNSGFLVGHGEAEVTSVLVSLDITEDVVKEAKERGAQLIVAHHPVIFHPAREITDSSPTGRILLALIENRIAAICAHTNLDATVGGVNDCLADALNLSEIGQLCQNGVDDTGNPYGIGRVGLVHQPGMSAAEYAKFVKEKLNSNSVRFVDAGKPVYKVAVGGGSCSDMVKDALAAGCDTFVTSDIRYNAYLDAKEFGVNLMDAGHYPTERVICPMLERYLQAQFPDLCVSTTNVHREIYQSIGSEVIT